MNEKRLAHFNSYLEMICLDSIRIFGVGNNAAVLSSVLSNITTKNSLNFKINNLDWHKIDPITN